MEEKEKILNNAPNPEGDIGVSLFKNEIIKKEKKELKLPIRMAIRYYEEIKKLELRLEKLFSYNFQEIAKIELKLQKAEEQLNYWIIRIPEEDLEEYLERTTKIEERYAEK